LGGDLAAENGKRAVEEVLLDSEFGARYVDDRRRSWRLLPFPY
jgi:hypothetical protein